jgi:ferredoxin-NADP reductase
VTDPIFQPIFDVAAAPPPATAWQSATVTAIVPETARAKTFRLALTRPARHIAGQHYVVRLTAPDGYRAQRSYSVASAPSDDGTIELTVERLDGGEVSGFLHDVVEVGDELEVRGPIGGFFVWSGDSPAVLLGGGSGVVPLMSMLRFARATGCADLLHLVVSVRSADDLFYPDELTGPGVTVIYSRVAPAGGRPAGRLTVADLPPIDPATQIGYVCGSAGFAGAAGQLLLAAGLPAPRIKLERFGPTG